MSAETTINDPDILIVEDDRLNREIIAKHLRASDYNNIRFAADGQQALDQVAEAKPDLIILDIMLPEIMGLQVLHTLRLTHSMVELPIIMCTAIDEIERIVRALEIGANDYVTKPVNMPILMARVHTQLSLKQLAEINANVFTKACHDMHKPMDIILETSAEARQKIAYQDDVPKQWILNKLAIINQSARTMHNIAECVLKKQAMGLSQIRLTKAPVHIETLVADVVERHREQANQKKISMISKYVPNKLMVEADPTRVAQILDSYVGNAINVCSLGDSVTITVTQKDNSAYVHVKDTGPNIISDKLTHLFIKKADEELEERTGLPLCKQIIDMHNGETGALNNKDKGVTFWFRLPAFTSGPVQAKTH